MTRVGWKKISRRKKGQLDVSYQIVTDPCCGFSVIFCGFISHLIGCETINIPEIFSGAHGFKDCNYLWPPSSETPELLDGTMRYFRLKV